MMKFVVAAVKPTGIPCTVSMNPIMIDGTGMCGGCRLTLHRDGERITKFACVDGPDFNGYEVDFDEAMSRCTAQVIRIVPEVITGKEHEMKQIPKSHSCKSE